MIIVGIKYFHNISCQIFLFYCFLVLPFVKGIQLEAFNSLCIPDTKRVYDSVAITNDRKIIGNRSYALIAFLNEIASSVFIHMYIDIATKFYCLGIFRSSQFKRIAVCKPVVRHLHLITISDLLLEHTVAVSDATAVSCIAQGCKGIKKARSQSSKTAVSKRCIRFLILNYIEIKSQFIKCFLHRFICL